MKALLVFLTFFALEASAQDYFCILARMNGGVPVEHDRKNSNLGQEPILLTLKSGHEATVESISVPATEYQPESSWLAVGISRENGSRADSLYSLDQTHIFLKLTDNEDGVSVQCSKR